MKLKDKVAIIAGGTKGIGLGIALEYVREGAKVVVGGSTERNGQPAVDAIEAAGGEGMFVKCDVASLDDLDNIIDKTVSRFGRLDIYVANAGINDSNKTHFLDITPDQYDRIMDVNLKGMFFGGQKAAQQMVHQGNGGVIINMSSGGATKAHRAFTAYDASKGGIEALTRAMALDLGPYNVRVNALMPGSIDTSGLPIEQRQLRGENVPLGRIGEASDMTGAALFLASDDASYITGDVLRIDGGMLAQQRSATVDIMPPSDFPTVESL